MINGANQCEKLCKNFSAISDKRILKRIEKKLRVKKWLSNKPKVKIEIFLKSSLCPTETNGRSNEQQTCLQESQTPNRGRKAATSCWWHCRARIEETWKGSPHRLNLKKSRLADCQHCFIHKLPLLAERRTGLVHSKHYWAFFRPAWVACEFGNSLFLWHVSTLIGGWFKISFRSFFASICVSTNRQQMLCWKSPEHC